MNNWGESYQVQHARVYSGVKHWISLQTLTLVHILPREGELRYDCIKTKPIKGYFNLFSCPFFKNTSENIEKKASKEKEGPVRCFYLYSQEFKPWKSLILWMSKTIKINYIEIAIHTTLLICFKLSQCVPEWNINEWRKYFIFCCSSSMSKIYFL